MEEINAIELKSRLDACDDIQLIDVRQPNEHSYAVIPGSTLIPLGEIISKMDELDPNRDTVVYCRSGARSASAINALRGSGYTGKLANLAGGILSWSDTVDPSVPKY